MKQHYFLGLFLVLFLALPAFSQTRVFLTSKDDNTLRIADSATLSINSTVAMTASGATITGVNGLDVHPCSGEIYVILKISGQTGRSLGTVDTLGNVNILGNTGDNFASIAFDDAGVLYGVTGDGANTPETLYTLDLSSANPTLVVALGNGDDGESIAFNPDDGFMYHWSGLSSSIYERIDLSNNTITNITFLNPGVQISEVKASVYAGNGVFGVVNGDDSLFSITTNGLAVNMGVDMGFATRGFAFEGEYSTITVLGDTSICPGDTASLEAYVGTGYQWYRNSVLITGETNQQFHTTQGGHYNCIVTKPGCTDSLAAGVSIEALNAPTVNISPSGPVGICDGGSTVLSGSTGGSSQWYLNGVLLTLETNDSIVASSVGTYNMVKTNNNGCSDSASTGVEVFLLPNPTPTIMGDTGLCPGDSAVLMSATIYIDYLWSTNETTQNINITGGGTYGLTVTDPSGCIGSDSFTVNDLPAPFPILGADTTLCISLGGSTTLNPGAFDSYLWSDGSTDSSLFVDEGSFNDTIRPDTVTFTVIVTNEFGCEASDEVTIIGDHCFGIAESGISASVIMFPNPAADLLTIVSDESLESIVISDANGRIMTKTGTWSSGSFDVSSWPAGIYTVEFSSKDEKAYKKLIIQ